MTIVTGSGGTLRYTGGSNLNAYNYGTNTWDNANCRTIEFTAEHEVGVNITEEFYEWFMSNATLSS